MSPRTGRPKADNPKNIDIKVRIDAETNRNLLKYCEENGISRTEAIRKGIELLLEKNRNSRCTDQSTCDCFINHHNIGDKFIISPILRSYKIFYSEVIL